MAAVFISHASADFAFAEQLCHALEAVGVSCWIAPRDIPATSSWSEAIVQGIRECEQLVLLISEAANESRHVAREVERADAFEKGIVPVRLEDVPPSDELGYFLGRIQWIDCPRPDFEMALDRVVEHMRTRVVPATPAPVTLSPSWQALTADPLQIVLGRFLAKGSKTPEAIGYGDRKALIELRDHLRGVANVSVVYADLLDKSFLTGNLFLVGGTGANSVSKRFVKAVPQGFTFRFARGGHIHVVDTITDTRYKSENMPGESGVDYGVLVVAPNPFADAGTVVYASGSYSYGTWAGVQHTLTDEFATGDATEWLLKVFVENHRPARYEVLIERALPE